MDFDLFLKYFAGKADPEEALRVEEWAASSADNQSYFKALHQSWLEAGAEQYQAPDLQQEWERLRSRMGQDNTRPLKRGRRVWLSRAAAVAVIIATAFAGYYIFNSKNQNEPTQILAAKEKPEKIQLIDGTQVTIEPGGELVYPSTFTKPLREVTLVGSGSFDVTHKEDQPFVVHLGDLHIRVLGTSFSISRRKEKVSVQVNEGKIAFYNKSDTLLVAAGYIGHYTRADKLFRLEPVAPVTGSFQFNNVPLDEAVAALSAHFKIPISLVQPGTGNCRISAGFDAQPLKDILNSISATFNLTYKIEGQHIYIDGKACP